jgi:hypothetical protein
MTAMAVLCFLAWLTVVGARGVINQNQNLLLEKFGECRHELSKSDAEMASCFSILSGLKRERPSYKLDTMQKIIRLIKGPIQLFQTHESHFLAGGNDIAGESMSRVAAEAFCEVLDSCKGFTFQENPVSETQASDEASNEPKIHPLVFFKSAVDMSKAYGKSDGRWVAVVKGLTTQTTMTVNCGNLFTVRDVPNLAYACRTPPFYFSRGL